jgi:hypothetical protein
VYNILKDNLPQLEASGSLERWRHPLDSDELATAMRLTCLSLFRCFVCFIEWTAPSICHGTQRTDFLQEESKRDNQREREREGESEWTTDKLLLFGQDYQYYGRRQGSDSLSRRVLKFPEPATYFTLSPSNVRQFSRIWTLEPPSREAYRLAEGLRCFAALSWTRPTGLRCGYADGPLHSWKRTNSGTSGDLLGPDNEFQNSKTCNTYYDILWYTMNMVKQIQDTTSLLQFKKT